jgi:hypothetical protein
MSSESETLDRIIERAFLDVYHVEEQAMGLAIVVSDGLQPPFTATVVGEEVEVVETTKRESGLVSTPAVVCERDGERYTVDILDLEDWQHAEGAEYIAAYRKESGLEPWGEAGKPEEDEEASEEDGDMLEKLRDALVERLDLEGMPGEPTLDRLFDVFTQQSWEGRYYSSFEINSDNFRHVPDETEEWFQTMGLFLKAGLEAAEQGDETDFERLREMLTFLDEALVSDRVVFADELNKAMLPAETPKRLEVRYLDLLPDSYSDEEAIEAFEVVEYDVPTKRNIEFFLEHGCRERARNAVSGMRPSKLRDMLELLESKEDADLAETVARDVVIREAYGSEAALEWLRTRFHEERRREAIVDVRREQFERSPSLSRLDELQSAASRFDLWEEMASEVLSTLEARNPNDYVRWCLDRDRVEEAIETWREHGESDALEEDIAEAARDVAPDTTVEIRLRRAHEAIGYQRREYYRDACDELRAIRETLLAADRKEEWQQLVRDVLDEYDTYGAFQEVVEETGLVQ